MSSWKDPAEWERMRDGSDCRVCRSRDNALVELAASWVLVGPGDPVRGYACLVLNRHAIELHDLSEREAASFIRDAQRLSAALAALVQPVKMNYEIHGNRRARSK